MMVQGANGSYTHQGKYAWDFIMEEGTKICASRKGLVVQVKEDSSIGGPDISFMKDANRITVFSQRWQLCRLCASSSTWCNSKPRETR